MIFFSVPRGICLVVNLGHAGDGIYSTRIKQITKKKKRLKSLENGNIKGVKSTQGIFFYRPIFIWCTERVIKRERESESESFDLTLLKMVNYMLKIAADLENLTNLQPQGGCDDPSFSYLFKVSLSLSLSLLLTLIFFVWAELILVWCDLLASNCSFSSLNTDLLLLLSLESSIFSVLILLSLQISDY